MIKEETMDVSPRMVKVTIDGKATSVRAGTTILQCARELGIDIPSLCYHPALEPYGVCRVCIVEIRWGKRTRIVTACNYPLQDDGLEVFTNSERIQRDRRVVIEMLLARCWSSPVIREFAARFGIHDTDLETTENEECTLCGLCVNVCRDLIGQSAIGFEGRGADRRATSPFKRGNEDCIGCGACVYVCPTGCIKMEDLPQERVLQMWQNEIPLFACKSCGRRFHTVRQLEILKSRHPLSKFYVETCPECREKAHAELMLRRSGA